MSAFYIVAKTRLPLTKLLVILSPQVLDLNTISELASFTGEHARSRLFRSEGGVTDLSIMPHGKLYSCGADGTIKSRTLNFR